MTIKMRLDTEGLRSLIASNPELEVEIGKEVLANIKRETVHLQVEDLVSKILWGRVDKSGTYYAPVYSIKDVKLQRVIDAAVENAAQNKLQSTIDAMVEAALARRIGAIREKLQEELVASMQELLTPEMAQQLMKEKLFG